MGTVLLNFMMYISFVCYCSKPSHDEWSFTYIVIKSWPPSFQSNYVVKRSHNETKFYKSGFENPFAWWRHQLESFSALLAICAGNVPVPGEFPAQRPVTRSFDVFFDLRLTKRLSKQSWDWWFETLSRPFWRHCNGFFYLHDFGSMTRMNWYDLNWCVPI